MSRTESRTNPPQHRANAAAGVLTAIRWEWFRLSRGVPFWVVMGLLAAAVAGTLAIVAVLQFHPVDPSLPIASHHYPATTVDVLSVLGPFIAVILASLLFGGDFASGAWRALTARGAERWQAGLAKLLLLAAILLIFWISAWLAAAAVGLAVGEPASAQPGVSGFDPWGETLVEQSASWVVVIAYLGLGAVLASLGRSTSFGLGVGVAVILFELALYPVAGLIGDAVGIPVDDYTRWTLRGVTSRFIGGGDDLGRWAFLAPVLGYAALCWALTLYDLHRRDLGIGSG